MLVQVQRLQVVAVVDLAGGLDGGSLGVERASPALQGGFAGFEVAFLRDEFESAVEMRF